MLMINKILDTSDAQVTFSFLPSQYQAGLAAIEQKQWKDVDICLYLFLLKYLLPGVKKNSQEVTYQKPDETLHLLK